MVAIYSDILSHLFFMYHCIMKNILLIILCFPILVFSQEEKRLALVIGNANYNKGELKNPVNDALLIAETLKKLNFDIILDTNITNKRSFKETIRDFGNRRPDYDVAFVYYAGHGVQVGSENYLLPTKEVFASEYDIQDFGVSVQDIMRYLTGMSTQVNVLILDACRDNPFEISWNATRSLKGNGLAKISPPTGSLIAFSTDAGMTAADGDGINSIYCRSLSENLQKEDIGLEQVFKNVRSDVLMRSNNQQSPVESSKLTGTTFYLTKNFAVYNATIDEIFEVSDLNLKNGDYYKSIEILNEAANIFKKRGDKKMEINCRKRIIDNYFNKFQNSDTELHLFPLVHHQSPQLSKIIEKAKYDINTLFDFKSYNLFFDNLVYFSQGGTNISNESIYNFLVYVKYVLMIPIQNYRLDLELGQLNHDPTDYDRLLSDLRPKVKNYAYSSITNFWEFKLGYQSIRTHYDLKGLNHNKITIVNHENINYEFFKDMYDFIENCNEKKDYFSNDLNTMNFDQSYFFEKEIFDYTLKRYNSGIVHELERMIVDILAFLPNGETVRNFDVFFQIVNDYFSEINNGFQLGDNINFYMHPWILNAISAMSENDVLFNGYDSKSNVKLLNFSSLLLNYLTDYKEYLLLALKNNDQVDLINISQFNKVSNFDILGYYGKESYIFTNDNGLTTNYLFVIDSVIVPHISMQIETLTEIKKFLSNNNKIEWVKETEAPHDSRENLTILNSSEFMNISNNKIKKEIIDLERASKISEIIEIDVLPLFEMLDKTNVSGNSNGDVVDFYFFEWLSYLSELSSISKFSEEDHLIILNTLNNLKIKFSMASPNFSWDLKDISSTYREMILILQRTENHLVSFTIKKSIRKFIEYIPDIYDNNKVDNDYQKVIDSETQMLKKLLDN